MVWDALEQAQIFAELGQSTEFGEITSFTRPLQAVPTCESKTLGFLLV